MIIEILQDALFAALAAIGFSAISRPPRRAFLYCALIAAVGHSVRFLLMDESGAGWHILAATGVACFIVGTLAVFLSPVGKMPAETCIFPSLLPMIPGIYAYKTFAAFGMCVMAESQDAFDEAFFLCAHNGLTCLMILLVMVVGATLPIFIFSRISFSATRTCPREQ